MENWRFNTNFIEHCNEIRYFNRKCIKIHEKVHFWSRAHSSPKLDFRYDLCLYHIFHIIWHSAWGRMYPWPNFGLYRLKCGFVNLLKKIRWSASIVWYKTLLSNIIIINPLDKQKNPNISWLRVCVFVRSRYDLSVDKFWYLRAELCACLRVCGFACLRFCVLACLRVLYILLFCLDLG